MAEVSPAVGYAQTYRGEWQTKVFKHRPTEASAIQASETLHQLKKRRQLLSDVSTARDSAHYIVF